MTQCYAPSRVERWHAADTTGLVRQGVTARLGSKTPLLLSRAESSIRRRGASPGADRVGEGRSLLVHAIRSTPEHRDSSLPLFLSAYGEGGGSDPAFRTGGFHEIAFQSAKQPMRTCERRPRGQKTGEYNRPLFHLGQFAGRCGGVPIAALASSFQGWTQAVDDAGLCGGLPSAIRHTLRTAGARG